MAGWRISSPAHVIERECGVAAVPFYGLYPAEKRPREPSCPRECCAFNYCWRGHARQGQEEDTMPAVTVEDILLLPRISEPDPAVSRDRQVLAVTTAPSALEGEGFPVRRAFAGVDLGALDPFIHLDQMGEVDYAPGEPKGTAWHPHRGFETVA